MEWFPESKDHLPLTWWKQTPIYLAAVIALVGVASMVVTSLMIAVSPDLIMPLVFSFNHVAQHWWVWTPLTYVLVNPPNLWFLLTSYLLYSFGEALERHLGRWSFVKLILCLTLVTPALLLLIGLVGGPREWPAMGMNGLEFGVFIAFAALYPTARVSIIILTLEVWVLATAFVGISVLSALASRDWSGLLMLAGQVAIAVGYIRLAQGRLQMPKVRLWSKPRPQPVVQRRPEARSASSTPTAKKEAVADVDAILEKISRHGIASLTDQEKRALEQASERLSKRNR